MEMRLRLLKFISNSMLWRVPLNMVPSYNAVNQIDIAFVNSFSTYRDFQVKTSVTNWLASFCENWLEVVESLFNYFTFLARYDNQGSYSSKQWTENF